ncbi:19582_t:CDS:2 [Dentiscutata erythropus]|uniref:19582_t:CDS:1 n=1 Tax=Dentiscutata erythropus TaxID=1348616 RepID=A0A9N9HAH9_9GLOM|nr:19582_t:CDS:2 [Dentiscutata erythropus]
MELSQLIHEVLNKHVYSSWSIIRQNPGNFKLYLERGKFLELFTRYFILTNGIPCLIRDPIRSDKPKICLPDEMEADGGFNLQ